MVIHEISYFFSKVEKNQINLLPISNSNLTLLHHVQIYVSIWILGIKEAKPDWRNKISYKTQLQPIM